MASVFLRDWNAGDVVTAADLQELVYVVGMLENTRYAFTGSSHAGGGVQRECDGPVEWPWQVQLNTAASKTELRVVPGRVLIGGEPVWTNEEGESVGGFQYVTIKEASSAVPGFDESAAEPQVVYLCLRGHISTRVLMTDELWPDTAEEGKGNATAYQYAELTNARLDLQCMPMTEKVSEEDELLRVWPLAVFTPDHEQPVTQLLWGDLSAVECRGLVDNQGDVVWPADRSGAAEWGSDAHGDDMAVLTEADFSTPRETITGPLRGCVDTDGALEFYLGVHPE